MLSIYLVQQCKRMLRGGDLCRGCWDVSDVLLPLARGPEVRELGPWTWGKGHGKGEPGFGREGPAMGTGWGLRKRQSVGTSKRRGRMLEAA